MAGASRRLCKNLVERKKDGEHGIQREEEEEKGGGLVFAEFTADRSINPSFIYRQSRGRDREARTKRGGGETS